MGAAPALSGHAAPSGPAAPPGPAGPGRAHWLRVTRETADDLATDAVAREQAGKVPFDEVSRLREAGLLGLLAPVSSGGGGADWATAYAVVREIAAADAAIGQLLGSHYFLSWSAGFLAGPVAGARTEQWSAAGQWCWGGGLARQEAPLVLTRSGHGHVLHGRQSYAAGVLVADRVAVRAVRADTGEPVAVTVDPAHPGLAVVGDADAFGQRLAGGGSVECDGVPVAADEVLGSLSADEAVLSPRTALVSPVGRLLTVQLRLGVAEGVLAEVREYSRGISVPDRAAGPAIDPQALSAYGELTVLTRSASALADQAREAVRRGVRRGEDLTYDEYAELSVLVAMAEAAAAGAARESTARALDLLGARAASSRLGLDRFWRNARTQSLHEPVGPRLRDVGDYFLSGAHPPFVLPT
ncbi:acyl-CoA dehydrogenase family protein [Streptomyces sp. NPDC048182]|uniref:acyl-CoA dehydrogenase family protein n=1 Tax=Streptomyces sp. NPDC048182 TaxID=3365507 RepID=UPI003722892E